MEWQARPKEYILQGLEYLYTGNTNKGYSRLTFRDPIDMEKMQEALSAMMEKSDYFRVRLVQEGEEFFLYPNDEPCLVYTDAAQRKIPEETNGYQFYVSCSGCTLMLKGTHFLADGQGWGSFTRTLAKEYCNRRYGEAFVCPSLSCKPPLSAEELSARCSEKVALTDSTKGILRWKRVEERTLVVRLKQDDVIRNAAEAGVTPFCYLLYLCCRIIQQSMNADQVVYSIPVDARAAVGMKDALYNCTALFRNSVSMEEADADIMEKLQQSIDERTEKNAVLNQYWNIQSTMNAINNMDIPLRMKALSSHMASSRSFNSHFIFSYFGTDVFPKRDRCARFLKDIVITDMNSIYGSLFITEATVNDKMVLTFQDSYGIAGLDGIIRDVMNAYHVPPDSMENVRLFE